MWMHSVGNLNSDRAEIAASFLKASDFNNQNIVVISMELCPFVKELLSGDRYSEQSHPV